MSDDRDDLLVKLFFWRGVVIGAVVAATAVGIIVGLALWRVA